MHTAHCARHITLCLKCNEPIPKRQFDEHTCRKEKDETEGSGSSGGPKPVIKPTPLTDAAASHNSQKQQQVLESSMPICQYCELEFPQAKLSEHEHYCGSRTEQCPECSDYVMLREWDKHQSMRLYHGNLFQPSHCNQLNF